LTKAVHILIYENSEDFIYVSKRNTDEHLFRIYAYTSIFVNAARGKGGTGTTESEMFVTL